MPGKLTDAAKAAIAEGEARRLIVGTPYTIRYTVDNRDGVRKYFLFGPTGYINKTARAQKLLSTIKTMLGVADKRRRPSAQLNRNAAGQWQAAPKPPEPPPVDDPYPPKPRLRRY
jgi:hypothetical protein